ncbi:hypothetical protein [Salaquimonas pukyongi]|nr:hypothetical protein [Salaquimonas pukyongi]
MSERNSPTQMPKWLLYGIIGKLAAIVLIVVIVLWYAGIFG